MLLYMWLKDAASKWNILSNRDHNHISQLQTFTEELDTDYGKDGQHDQEWGSYDDPYAALWPNPPQDGPEW